MSCILLLAYVIIHFQSLQSIAKDDEKHYQCQNIVLNNKSTQNWTIIFGIELVNLITVCIDGRDIVASADKGMT